MSAMGQVWSFALYANCGGSVFFFFVGITDNFSWLIECVLWLCAVSNLLWLYMFHQLQRSQNTLMLFGGLAALSVLGAILHWRRPVVEANDDSDSDSDSDGLSFEERIAQEELELAQLKLMQKRRLEKMKQGQTTDKKPLKDKKDD